MLCSRSALPDGCDYLKPSVLPSRISRRSVRMVWVPPGPLSEDSTKLPQHRSFQGKTSGLQQEVILIIDQNSCEEKKFFLKVL